MAFWDFLRDKPNAPAGLTLQESVVPMGYDPDANLTATTGGSAYYRRLTASRRDMEPLQQQKMQDIAAYLYDSNPLAKRALELTRDYVLGDGVTIEAKAESETEAEKQQDIIDRFWDDPVNNLDIELHQLVLDQEIFGELFLSVKVNPVDGHVRLAWIDPASVVEVIRDPDNPKIAIAVKLKGPTGHADIMLLICQVDETPGSAWYGRVRGVLTDKEGNILSTYKDADNQVKPFDGECLYYPINQITPSSRGRSDLLCLSDWIDAYDQLLFSEVDRMDLLKTFVWDVTLTGANDAMIDAYAKNNPTPKKASVRYHNESAIWQAITPSLNSADAAVGMDGILSYISTGAGKPKTWFSGSMDVNLATATALSEPAFKALTLRQKHVKYILTQLLTFVLDQAEIHGVLAKRKKQGGAVRPEPWPVVVNMPELRPKDLKLAADTLLQATSALSVAKAEGVIDGDVMQDVVLLLIEQMGIEVDKEALVKRLEELEAEAEAKAEAMPPVVPNEEPPEQEPKEGE